MHTHACLMNEEGKKMQLLAVGAGLAGLSVTMARAAYLIKNNHLDQLEREWLSLAGVACVSAVSIMISPAFIACLSPSK